jgi:predicted  nucleic acid-binding Zn-ribbon protein
MKRCSDICKSLDISTWTSHLSDYERKAFREARNIAERVRLLDHTLQDAGARIKDTRSKLKGILEGSEGAIKALKAAEDAVAKDQSRGANNEKDIQGSQESQGNRDTGL